MTFYGVIREIWELDYITFQLFIFLCDWVESNNDVREDELGFPLVNLNQISHKSDPFILATQAKQLVLYINDPLDGQWSVVLASNQKTIIEGDWIKMTMSHWLLIKIRQDIR